MKRKRLPEWYEARQTRLGASEVSTILGLNEYQSPWEVWAVKTGILPPFEGNKATQLGDLLEPALIDEAEDDLGPLVRDMEVAMNNAPLPLVATCDAVKVIDNKIAAPVECKTAGMLSGFADGWGDPGLVTQDDQVPQQYFVQVQMQLACTEAELAHLYALLPRRGIVKFQVMPDFDLQTFIVGKLAEWWDNHIVKGIEPPRDGVSLSALKRLRRIKGKSVELPDHLFDLLAERASYADAKRKMSDALDEVDAKLVAALGDADRGEFTDGTVIKYPEISVPAQERDAYSYRRMYITRPKDKDI